MPYAYNCQEGFRGAPRLYEVVSALILCLIKALELFDFLSEFLRCLSKIS